MSDEPVIFKRNKSSKQQRARQNVSENGDRAVDANLNEQEESPLTVAAKLKKRVKPKSRLSFGLENDEEGDKTQDFKIRKSNLSQSIRLGHHPGLGQQNTHNNTSLSEGPTYSKAYLDDLKASTPSRRPQLPLETLEDVEHDTLSTATTFEDTVTSIPTETLIADAKKKREELRAIGPEDDYISLTVTKSEGPVGPHPSSRLVREEDEYGEGDDEFAEYTSAQDRIALGKKSRKVESAKRKEAIKDMIDDAEGDENRLADEEELEWENEQLRRGGHRSTDDHLKQTKVYKPTPIPNNTAIPTLHPALHRLATAMSNLETTHANNLGAVQSVNTEMDQLDIRKQELRSLIDATEAKRAWFSSFREWVEGVAAFLDTKFPLLEALETEQLSIYHERRTMIDSRRRLDDEDDLAIIFGEPPITKSEIKDDFGRDLPQNRPEDGRRTRRMDRSARRQSRRTTADVAEEGYSTDGSLSLADSNDYDQALRRLKTDGLALLADVKAEDFLDPDAGLAKWFTEWRVRYADIYHSAFGGLGMIGAWEFWSRLEIIDWDPFQDVRSMDSFKWFSSLHRFSYADLDEQLGPDGDLVSSMLATAIIPRLCKIIEQGAFDPYSGKHVRRLVDLSEEVEALIQSSHDKFQMLLKSAYAVFELAQTELSATIQQFLSLPHAKQTQDFRSSRSRYLHRQVKLLKNILKWRKYTGERFGAARLCQNLIESSIIPTARREWDEDAKLILVSVHTILPPDIRPPSLSNYVT